MAQIRIDLQNQQNKTVNVFKAIHNLSSKEDSVIGIIQDWEKIQTASLDEIYDAVIKKIKEEHQDTIRQILNSMRSCYEDYDKGMEKVFKELCKKYKKTEKQMCEILDGECYEEGEDSFKDKVWSDWNKPLNKMQEELAKKYHLYSVDPEVINHEEGWFEINHVDESMGLEFIYIQYEEEIELTKEKKMKFKKDDFKVFLDFSIKRGIEKAINILRGENSINNILEESQDYFKEKQERERKAREDNLKNL
jgi:hypothetical protein